MKLQVRVDVLLCALGLVSFLCACSFVDVNQDSNQAQGITQPSGPSPSPGAPCACNAIARAERTRKGEV